MDAQTFFFIVIKAENRNNLTPFHIYKWQNAAAETKFETKWKQANEATKCFVYNFYAFLCIFMYGLGSFPKCIEQTKNNWPIEQFEKWKWQWILFKHLNCSPLNYS